MSSWTIWILNNTLDDLDYGSTNGDFERYIVDLDFCILTFFNVPFRFNWITTNSETNIAPFIITKKIISLIMPLIFAVILGAVFGTAEIVSRRTYAKHHKLTKKATEKNEGHMLGEKEENIFSASLDVAMAKRFKLNSHGKDHHTGHGLLDLSSAVTPFIKFQGSLVIMACKCAG